MGFRNDTADKTSRRTRATGAAKLVFSIGVLVFLFYRVDLRKVVASLTEIRPALLCAAVGLYTLGQLVSAGKWSMIAAALGFRRPYSEYATFYFIGMFVNLLGPSTVGGDLTRGLYLGGDGRRALALHSVFFDRASGLVVLAIIGLGALLAFPRHDLPPALTRATAGLLILLLSSWWVLPRVAARFLRPEHKLRRLVSEDLGPFWRDRRLLGKVAVTSAGFHLIHVAAQYVIARSLGLEVPFSYCLILHPAVSVLAALPISVAGLGVREGGYVFFLSRIGVLEASAMAFGLVWFAMAVVAALPGGVLLLMRRDSEVHPATRESGHSATSRGCHPPAKWSRGDRGSGSH